MKAICAFPGCGRPKGQSAGFGLCYGHYKRLRRKSAATGPISERGASTENRFWDKIMPEPNSGCWLWIGAIGSHGYGTFSVNRRAILAHRFSFEMRGETIPNGMFIDHKCSNRQCVNPDHLHVVTPAENARLTSVRGRAQRYNLQKTHCPVGHPYSGDNLYMKPADGSRMCRICMKRYDRNARMKSRGTNG